MPEINDILTALDNAYTGGSDRVEWVAELKPILQNLTNELKKRGIVQVANTTSLSSLKGSDVLLSIVTGVGIFLYQASGVPNGTTVFAASGTGVYVLIFSGGGGGSLVTETVNVTNEATKNIAWDAVRLAAFGQWPKFFVWLEHDGGIWRSFSGQFTANHATTPTAFTIDFGGPVNAKILIS